MKLHHCKSVLRRLSGALAFLGIFTLIPDAPACPQDSPIQRSTDPFSPYFRVWDFRITNSPGTDTQGYDPPGGRNASLALSITGIIAVAYERPDPENENGNALSLQRFNANFALPGGCICDRESDPPFDFVDDCPFRLDDAPTNGTIFSHVSRAIARKGGYQH